MSKEAMKLALEALKELVAQNETSMFAAQVSGASLTNARSSITALREALAEQPAQQGCMRCNTPKKCALYGCSPLTWPSEKPAQQEPVAFPTRRAVEREIERISNPTGMHLNDAKERVTLPGGTLRFMLALIDRTSPPAQRTWVGLTEDEVTICHSLAILSKKHDGTDPSFTTLPHTASRRTHEKNKFRRPENGA